MGYFNIVSMYLVLLQKRSTNHVFHITWLTLADRHLRPCEVHISRPQN